jgi:hypothetical protein
VDPPIVCLRPTTRFAYWIGTRRCPWSMYTTATMIATPSNRAIVKAPGPRPRRIAPNSNGSREITEVKIRIDMPLPTPRCVISSPSHMISAVPAVITSTINSTFVALNDPGVVNRSGMFWLDPLWNRNTSPADCRNASATVT